MKILTKPWFIFSIFLIGFLVRMLLSVNPGFVADICFWKSWGLAPFDHGIVWSLHNTNNNYPAPFSYVLLFLVKIYSIFKDPHNFNEFWQETNLLFLVLAKMPSILADMGIAILIFLIGKNPKKFSFPDLPSTFYLLLSTIYLFSPLALIDGAVWGQVDSLGVFVFFVSILLVIRGNIFLGGFVYMVSMMTKMQNMIYGPLFFIFVWQCYGLRGLIRALAASTLAFFGLNIEFLLARDMGRVVDTIVGNYDYFPLLSLNAYNVWWIVASGLGMKITDKITFLGLMNAKTTGLMLFISGYLMATLTMLKDTIASMFQHVKTSSNSRVSDSRPPTSDLTIHIMYFLIALILANGAFFFFQTESHDRYLFPLSVFALLLSPFLISYFTTVKQRILWWKTVPFKIFISGYILYTGFYFINLHNALIENYPNSGISALMFLTKPEVTIPLSYILIGLYFAFIISLIRIIKLFPILVSILCLLTSVIIINMPLILKKPISLTKFTPIEKQQGYGSLVVNMPTNAAGASKNWNRLSVQYNFYNKGFGTHAKSYLVFDLKKQFKRFTSDMGIDTEAGPQGTVVFEIYGDDRLLYRSDLVKRFEYPRHADVDITGIYKLQLVVQDGGDGITDDHADWLNPLLIP